MAERGRTPGRVQGIAETWPPRGGARTGGLAAASGEWPRIFEKVREWVRAEAGAGRLLPWVPIAFGTGIAFYFAADHEPVLSVTVVTAVVLGIAAFLLRRNKVFPAAVMVASVAAGFATATFRTAHVAHEVLARPAYSVSLSGFVEARDVRERTDRFVLRVTQMDGPRLPTKLDRVRLSVRKGALPEVGSFVEMKARLQPPLAPLRPGSYDFSRDLFFQGIGASSFVTGSIKASEPPVAGGLSLRYAAFMQDLRDAIDARIRTTLEGDKRAIATALLTGRRDAITTPVNDAMFISGLGHVLSISGYHMAVVAGVVFFAIRALLALVPVLTVTYPIKKWAAAAALFAAAFYLLLSGAEVATQRSFYMTAVVLIAVIVDRRAITFRTLALAAIVVLVLAPEALVHPSFQMSFAEARSGRAGSDRHAAPVCNAGEFRGRESRAVGWARAHDSHAGFTRRRPCHHTVCRFSFSPGDAVWRAGQSGRHAGRLRCRDARGHAGTSRHALRLRRLLLVADGYWHRLDDRRDRVGRGASWRHRPDHGLRRRSIDRVQPGNCAAGTFAHAVAMVRGGPADDLRDLGGGASAA